MSAHMYTYTYIHTRTQNVHMNARKNVWNDSAAANVQGAVADKKVLHVFFVRRNQNHISHLQCKDFIVPTSCSTSTPPPPNPSSQHTPEQFAAAGKRIQWSTLIR